MQSSQIASGASTAIKLLILSGTWSVSLCSDLSDVRRNRKDASARQERTGREYIRRRPVALAHRMITEEYERRAQSNVRGVRNVLLQAIRDYSKAEPAPSREGDGADARTERSARRLKEQIPAYLANCRHNVGVMLAALDRSDFEAVTILGHNLRGSGGGFGFQAITDLGAGLERACEETDLDAARKLVRDLSSYLEGAHA